MGWDKRKATASGIAVKVAFNKNVLYLKKCVPEDCKPMTKSCAYQLETETEVYSPKSK